MAAAPSFQDLLDVGQAEAQGRRPDLLFLPGDITVAQLHGAAAMADRVVGYAAEAFRNTFLGGAKGQELTDLVADRYDIARQAATPAQVLVTFTRTSGGASGSIPSGTKVGSAFDPAGSQIVFELDAAVSVGAAANGPFNVYATAVDTGTAGNVAAGTVTEILDALYDTTFHVTNVFPAGGGNLEESDFQLVGRVRTFFETLHRGTLAALEYGALQVPSVRVAHAKEDPTSFAVSLLVTDADGNSSFQMVADVYAEIENWRCAGISVNVIGGVLYVVDLDIHLTQVRPGFDTADAAAAIIEVVTARVNRLKTEQTLYLDTVIAAVISVAPDDIFDLELTADRLAGVTQWIAHVVPPSGGTLRVGSITVT